MSSEQWKLTDEKLYCVAQKISDWYGVGLKLHLSANELDIIQANICREHTQRIAFEMLRMWRCRNHSRATKDALKVILQTALESVVPSETQAVEELNTDANQVQVDAQVRGNAVVTQVTEGDGVEPMRLRVDMRPDPH